VTYDVGGNMLRVNTNHTGFSAYIDTFIVQVDVPTLDAATSDVVGSFKPEGGTVNLGDVYKFTVTEAASAAGAGSLNLGLPGSPFGSVLDGGAGNLSEYRIVVPALGNGNFARSRVFTGAGTDWKTEANVYFAVRYNEQASFSEPESQTALSRSQNSVLDVSLPVSFTAGSGNSIGVKVFTAANGAEAKVTTAQFSGSLIP
jgi:hypothetical protein